MNNSEKRHLKKKIRELEGLNEQERLALLRLLNKDKKYGLVWEEKEEDIEGKLRDELPVLIERNDEKVHPIISENPGAPNHLIIEGDNLAALTELSYTHAGKIDVIYIDPPYNTGNKDFIYNDSYVEKEDSFRHSKWLSFMAKRLKIAKRLLTEKGVIFISIDDNEQANLKILCDEIFGNLNFVGTLPRITKKSGKAHSDDIARNHDFIVIYTQNNAISFKGILSDAKGFDKIDEYIEERGKYKLNQTLDYNSLWYNPAMDFPIKTDKGVFYAGGEKDLFEKRHSGFHNPKDWVWRWSQAKFDFGLKNGFIVFKKGKKGIRIYTKTYLNASIEKDENGEYFIKKSERETKMSSLALIENDFSNDNAKKELSDYLDANAFDFPKPTKLIIQLLNLIRQKSSYILDFFAGSGTTLHAVMKLNAEDGGNRTCILCTNNENNICEDVTYERNKRVIEGYTKPNGEFIEGLKDNNLRYYRTEFLPRERSVKNMRELVHATTGLLCIKNDLYTESDFNGKKLNAKYAKYFDDGKQSMLVIYDERAIPFIVNIIREMPEETRIKVYVFSHGSYAYNDEFEEVEEKVKLCALPQAIYDAYQKVLPKRRPRFLEGEIVEENVDVSISNENKDNQPGSLDLFSEEIKEGGAQ